MSAWIEQMLRTESPIIRRNRNDVEKYASIDELVDVVANRGWHLLEIADQLLVLRDPYIRILA